ncbi:hypothetical protein BAE44_0025636 [Dichanthelium oligosanthes]|uniref:Uncharacterized protein n=1 Tax=Dichanthelium oligosanthes TaxID=888268 RepID=A0A1E5UKM5_9POAL|nr:hypothetical protein BAE44_0025636 [Dichanthelium oligosanthes]
MARSIDSDYIEFSHIGGFNMRIDFDGFEENVMKLIELPIMYLDSAHDKAVEFIEDVQAMFYAPFIDDDDEEEPYEEDQSSSNVITESSPTSIVETELVGPDTEASTHASLITVENSSTGCVDTDAHETESFSTESTGLSLINHVYPENTSSEGGHVEANDLGLLPETEDTSPTAIYDSSEEVILWNPETSVKPPRPSELTTIPQDDHAPYALETDKEKEQIGLHCSGHSDSSVCSGEIVLENCSADYEEEVILHSANDPVEVTLQDILVDSAVFFEALLQEDSCANYEEKMVSYSANGPVETNTHGILVDSAVFFEALLQENSSANYEDQMVSFSENDHVEATTHGTSISHESSSEVPSCADDQMPTDNAVQLVDINLRDGQELMENDKIELLPPALQRKNASFKKMFMRSLSSKFRLSKKQANTHQDMPAGAQDAENPGYQLVSSSDDLEDDWEVL